MELLNYFRILKALIILFLLFFYMNLVPNQNGKVLKETLVGINSGHMKTTLSRVLCFKMTFPLFQVLQKYSPFLCHFITHNREYCEWF